MTHSTTNAELLRRILLYVLLFSMLGTAAELLLLEHTENWTQLMPLAALALGVPATLLVLLRARRTTIVVLRTVMVALIVAGVAGLYFHYCGNAEFELERRPTLAGWSLLWASLRGATPALSPGVLAQFGVLGLLATIRHPAAAHNR